MPRTKDLPCSQCGKLGWRGKGVNLDGTYVCRDCRRRLGGVPYKRRSSLSRSRAFYGPEHYAVRRRLLPQAIGTPCAICRKVMTADQKLHLDHSTPIWAQKTRRPGDRIVHAWCNVGWNRGLRFNTTPRASSAARGYGAAHQKLRKAWKIRVDAGEIACSACGKIIDPATKWHLAHDPDDRSRYAGPQHAHCNLSEVTATRRTNGNGNGLKTSERPPQPVRSRVW